MPEQRYILKFESPYGVAVFFKGFIEVQDEVIIPVFTFLQEYAMTFHTPEGSAIFARINGLGSKDYHIVN